MSQDNINENIVQDIVTRVSNILLENRAIPSIPQDEHVSTNIPATVLNVYPELEEFIPSLKDDFFRTVLSEEEKKEGIYACPKVSTITYSPPPINEAASSTIRKNDSALYGIQSALIHGTRPIDYFIHRRIVENPGISTEDPVIEILNTVRCIMGNVAAMATQARLDNLHSGMRFKGKPEQLVESQIRPLMDPEVFEAQLSAVKTETKKKLKRPFRQSPQYSNQASGTSTVTAQTPQDHPPARETTGEEDEARAEDLNRGLNESSSRRTIGDIQSRLGEADGQSMGPEYRQEWVYNTILQSQKWRSKRKISQVGSWIRRRGRRPQGGFCRKLRKFLFEIDKRSGSGATGGDLRSPPAAERRVASIPGLRPGIDAPSSKEIQKGEQGILPGNLRRSFSSVGKEGNRRELQEIPEIQMDGQDLPIQSSSVWPVTEPVCIHQGSETSPKLGTYKGYPYDCLLGRPVNNWPNQGYMQTEYNRSIQQVIEPGIQSEDEQVTHGAITEDYTPGYDYQLPNHESEGSSRQGTCSKERSHKTYESQIIDIEGPVKLHWESTGNVSGIIAREINAPTTLGTKEPMFVKEVEMDRPSDSEQPGYQQSRMVEEPIIEMERNEFHTRDTRTGNIHRCQRHGIWDNCGISILLHAVDRTGEIATHQRERIISNLICSPPPLCCWKVCLDLFRQYHVSFLRKEIWWHYFTKIAGDFRTNLVTLPKDKDPSPSDICPYVPQSCRCSIKNVSSTRMVTRETNIQPSGQVIRNSRHRLVCSKTEHPASKVLQLLPRPILDGSECTNSQMEGMDNALRMSPMESYSNGNPEGTTRTVNSNNSNTTLDISNLVSRSDTIVDPPTNNPAIINSNTRSKKRKIAIVDKQSLVSDSLEDQRSILKNQGLSEQAIAVITGNDRAKRRKSRYYGIQRDFLDWRNSNKLPNPITGPQIINFLSKIYTERKLKPSSIKSYKSALLRLVSNAEIIAQEPTFKEFMKAMDKATLTSLVHQTIDITPVITRIREWGLNEKLDNIQLTTKCAWLLAVTGFLRASDISRIDLSKSEIRNNILYLVILAPKEKRKGSPIIKPTVIKSHEDSILCPVEIFRAYTDRIACTPCIVEHINNKTIKYNCLMRYANDSNMPLSTDSITRYINNLSALIARPDNTPIPKGRAIGATLAAAAGISADTIVSHGFWSSYYIYDTHYRLSRSTQEDLTNRILTLE
ncbi:hypothetical protein BB559_002962 [Furculomyces boomerangus]|uniref:Core-binding (CB) domain-containing protein n=1 Tax=Furculomyces boomerangus TaxID=61424 RepID=A0A2T9YQH2_9FUNG|nr:hypothetical protein BB559_002962 [Furculomyces boomerangus]